eukprot:CAMPEP_0202918052 /NCGR_PEP_ID=MMETSP1392-20130828/72553_1 /ASSEMBLY_ACC=CAM_ASM_000868 /TAXON_ID=225041 /ORGANISM="Chlamydomonas chlamydogama, Strain SAG 11-48b" /LENGTH=97 /DNA_ID=CAMNT_0049610991 /DNA_START=1 /DNA_END=291 /DNA_ORIENTATION=+
MGISPGGPYISQAKKRRLAVLERTAVSNPGSNTALPGDQASGTSLTTLGRQQQQQQPAAAAAAAPIQRGEPPYDLLADAVAEGPLLRLLKAARSTAS